MANLINCTFIQLRLSSVLMLWSTERGIIQFKPLSIHSSDTDTVNNLRGFSFPLVSKWSRFQSISEAGVNITQWDKGKPLRRRKTSQMTSFDPCSDLQRFQAVCLPMLPTVVRDMEGTV